MRSLQPDNNTPFYAGVHLHATSLFLAILDSQGQTRYARNLAAAPKPFLQARKPFRHSVLVGCDCMHSGYWLADTCHERILNGGAVGKP